MTKTTLTFLMTAISIVSCTVSFAQNRKLTFTEKEKIKDSRVTILAYEDHIDPFVTQASVVGKGNRAELQISTEEDPKFYLTRLVLNEVDSLFATQSLMNVTQQWPDILILKFREQLKDNERFANLESEYVLELIVPSFYIRSTQYTLLAKNSFNISLFGSIRLTRLSDHQLLWSRKINIDGKKNKALGFELENLQGLEGEAFTRQIVKVISQEYARIAAEFYRKGR